MLFAIHNHRARCSAELLARIRDRHSDFAVQLHLFARSWVAQSKIDTFSVIMSSKSTQISFLMDNLSVR